MIRCNGFCSGGRAIRATRTLVGKAAPSAERKAHCSAAWPGIAARSTRIPSASSTHCLTGIPTGTAVTTSKTWTFLEQTKSEPIRNQTA